MLTREGRARLSYAVDAAQFAATSLFLYAWVCSVNGPTAVFSRQFMTAGFCNSPEWPTQWGCVCVDALGAAVFVAMGAVWPAQLTAPVVGYLFAHGYGHFEVATGLAIDHDILDGKPTEIIILAIILAIGPAEISRTCTAAGLSKPVATTCFVAAEALVVGIFAFAIKRSVFALLYINVSIMLCITVAKLALLGTREPSHVAARADEPLCLTKLLSLSAVVAIMCAEPTLCELGFAAVGGHVWFDVALLLDALVGTYNLAHSPKLKSS